MSSESSSGRRSARRGTPRVEHTSTSVRIGPDMYAAREWSPELRGGGGCEILLVECQYVAHTARDDRLEVDDRIGKRGAVKRLASHFESGEEERGGHRNGHGRGGTWHASEEWEPHGFMGSRAEGLLCNLILSYSQNGLTFP
jgi:hypothetical protein